MPSSYAIGLRAPLLTLLLTAGSLLAFAPARSQDTTTRIRPGTVLRGEILNNPSRVLPQDLSERFEVRELRPNLFQVNPEVVRQLREDPVTATAPADSTRIYTATLSSGIRKIPAEQIPASDVQRSEARPSAGAPDSRAERLRAARSGPSVQGDRYVLPVEALAVRGNRVSGYYRPFIEAPTGGLALNPENELFRGSLYLGVWDTLNPTGTEDLPSPIAFQIAAEGAEVNPSQLSIRHTHIPLHEVQIQTRELRDSIRLTVWTSLSSSGIEVPLRISRPDLSVRPSPSREIPGFGLGTAQLTVELGRLGGEGTTVNLRAQRGQPRPQQVQLSGSRTGTAEIRSSHVGADTVTVSAPGFADGTTVLRYAFPWSFLLATLLGGVLGASLQHLKRRSEPGETRGLIRQLTGGTITALIVGVASTVGVNFLPITFSAQYGEALFFTIAAVAAYLWETLDLGTAKA